MSQDTVSEKDPKLGSLPEAAPGSEQTPAKVHPEYDISIFRDWCKQCGICAAFCRQKCISLDENGAPVVDQADKCTGCSWCELHCPDFAIFVKELVSKEVKPEEAD